MKQLLRLFLSFFIFPAFAVTSESYVDSVLDVFQDEIPAVNTNTVLTNTGTPGEIGIKQIYDSTQSFDTQTNALVTAETFNTAVQNAIDNEFVCIEWLGEHVPGNCLLWKMQNTTQKTAPVANGFTQLEYITMSDGAFILLPGFATNDTSYDMIMTRLCTDPYRGLYGAASANSWPQGSGIQTYTGNTIYILNGSELSRDHAMTTGQEIHITQNGNIYSFQDASGKRTYTQPGGTFQTTYKITIGAITAHGNTRPCNSVWRYFIVSNMVDAKGNVIPPMHLLPVRRNADNVLGMYDTASGRFFTKSGTGKFIAGPDVVSNLYLPSGN